MKLQEITALLSVVTEMKDEVVKPLLKSITAIGPEVKELMTGISIGAIDIKANCVKFLETEHGFSRQDAIMMVSDQWSAISRNMKSSNGK